MQKLTITRPDDWHLHLRDGDALKAVLPHTVRQFARAIVMPNLKPPVRSVADAAAYRARIVAVIPSGQQFEPLMTHYHLRCGAVCPICPQRRCYDYAPTSLV
jgi:dihydroorotase